MPLLEKQKVPVNPEVSVVTEEIFFSSGCYRLNGRLAYPEMTQPWGAVIIAGPHPLLGGNMDNNVVRYLGDGLARKGLLTLRFDYRGVGQSEGPDVDVARHLAEFWQTSHAPEEAELYRDLQAACDYVAGIVHGQPLFFIGYSFGCSLLPRVARAANVLGRALIAPTITKHDYGFYQGLTSPLMVVISEDDFATDPAQVKSWLETLDQRTELVSKKCDNHFFRGHESWLKETILKFFQSQKNM